MKPKELSEYLVFAIENRFTVLIKSAPGMGKSDIVKQAAEDAGAELIIMHPVVSDPTDFKGLPFPNGDGTADFLPFGDLRKLIDAESLIVCLLDDLGQASASVQASVMQLLLAREINGKKISDHVVFIAATNGREHKAGVSGILEPVKSRFKTIIELEASAADWEEWAYNNNMPPELIAFIKFSPSSLFNFEPSKDLVNSACPRTVAAVGIQQLAGIDPRFEFEVYKGAAGEIFATEYMAFREVLKDLPSIDEIISNPKTVKVPVEPAALYTVSTTLAYMMTEKNMAPIMIYLGRLPKEFSMSCMQDVSIRQPMLTKTTAFLAWATKNKLKAA